MARRDRRKRARKTEDRESVLIGFRAYMDTDPDIASWWENLPEGQGSETMRRIVRAYIANPEFQQILALLHNLSRDVKAIGQQLNGAIVAGKEQPPPDGPMLTAEQAEARLDRILDNKW